ncbi:BON domain-containing protein [Pseudoduganella sp. UC29_106]|uniref:BON domain-containing protein n=1 Tax=Pseudoduganella sp. UC29_106 TaxID=3374553 RepID=UPI003757EB77
MKTLTTLPTLLSGFVLATLVACAASQSVAPTAQVVGDTELRSNVQAAMGIQPGLNATAITVDSYDGEVRLSGFLDSQEQIDQAVATARSVNGVKVVKNEMRLK